MDLKASTWVSPATTGILGTSEWEERNNSGLVGTAEWDCRQKTVISLNFHGDSLGQPRWDVLVENPQCFGMPKWQLGPNNQMQVSHHCVSGAKTEKVHSDVNFCI